MASDPAPGRRVLVVGATGILRPAALRLLARGDTVVAVARGRMRLTVLEAEGGRRVEVVPVDVTRDAAVASAVTSGSTLAEPLDAAIVYAPRPPADTFERVLGRVTGPVVRILTSAQGEPRRADGDEPSAWPWAQEPRRSGERRLLLGWTGSAEAPRWHTADEVSAAALDVLDRGADTVLGRLRPWADRP